MGRGLRIGHLQLPSWVPAPGAATTLTNSNGRLSNHLRDVISPLYLPAYACKIITDYAGGLCNPYFGPYGARQFFGVGHSGSNYNGVPSLNLDDVCTWVEIMPPTDYGGGTGGNDALDITSQLAAGDWGDTGAGTAPAGPHSWQIGGVLAPQDGGAGCGSIINIVNPAAGAIGLNFKAAHKLDLPSTTPSAGSWSRYSAAGGVLDGAWPAPVIASIVPEQMRAYIATNGNGAPRLLRWLDMAAGTYVTGSGVGFDYDDADSPGGGSDASGRMVYSAARRLLMVPMRDDGVLRIQWMDVSVDQPTVGGNATLSQTVTIAEAAWSAVCECPLTNRLIVFGAHPTTVYEIDIPVDPTSTWTVHTVALGATFLTGEEGSSLCRVFNKADWNPRTRCSEIVVTAHASTGDDVVSVYRPLGT